MALDEKSIKKLEAMTISNDVDRQNTTIRAVLEEMKEFLCAKNNSYDGSAFKAVMYAGNQISPMQTIDVRITDKIRRLQSSNPNFDGEDTEKDLLGYLILKLALKQMQKLPPPPSMFVKAEGIVRGGT